jgi:Tol biopolymer transport system component
MWSWSTEGMERAVKLLARVLVAGWISMLEVGPANAQTVSQSQHQTEPVNMGPVINSAARDAEPTFAADGKTMYFNCVDRSPGAGADICVSYLVDDEWTQPELVGPPISTEHMEVEPLLSPDGNKLYIMSNRPGGLGSADIWVSQNVDGEWTEPKNLGPPINITRAVL